MDFALSNEKRKYFGLDPLLQSWDRIELKNNVWIFFEATTLKKVIHTKDKDCYIERDYDLKTNHRKTLLPKTAKGKEKPLTLSSIEAHHPNNFSLEVRFDKRDRFESQAYAATIINRNYSSDLQAFTECEKGLKNFIQLDKWVDEFIETSPAQYLTNIDRLKKVRPTKVNYQSGDLFAFPMSRTSYGIGKIIFPVKHITSKKLVSPPHYFFQVPQVPLLVRLYALEIPCEDVLNIPLLNSDILKEKTLLPAYFMSDRYIYKGHYPIVANAPVTENELDFPISFDLQNNILCWGLGMTRTKRPLKIYIDPNTDGVLLRNNGVKGGAATSLLKKHFDGKEVYHEYEINHSKNKKIFTEIIRAAGLSPSITYDEFCNETQVFNSEELIELLKPNC